MYLGCTFFLWSVIIGKDRDSLIPEALVGLHYSFGYRLHIALYVGIDF